MKELTIESLKEISKRYNDYDSPLIKSFNNGTYKVSKASLARLLIQSITTFSHDDQLKKFLNEELPKLTKDDLKEIYNLKVISRSDITSKMFSLFNSDLINLTNMEKQFIFLYAWRQNCILSDKEEKMTIITFLKKEKHIKSKEIKKDIALALLEIDYLDYFNPNDYKRELFDISLKI